MMDAKKEKPSILPWGMTKDGLQPNSVQVSQITSLYRERSDLVLLVFFLGNDSRETEGVSLG